MQYIDGDGYRQMVWDSTRPFRCRRWGRGHRSWNVPITVSVEQRGSYGRRGYRVVLSIVSWCRVQEQSTLKVYPLPLVGKFQQWSGDLSQMCQHGTINNIACGNKYGNRVGFDHGEQAHNIQRDARRDRACAINIAGDCPRRFGDDEVMLTLGASCTHTTTGSAMEHSTAQSRQMGRARAAAPLAAPSSQRCASLCCHIIRTRRIWPPRTTPCLTRWRTQSETNTKYFLQNCMQLFIGCAPTTPPPQNGLPKSSGTSQTNSRSALTWSGIISDVLSFLG